MAAAAKNLTPVVLELGGKCPAIVHSSANLAVGDRRIAQGRWLNSGQTCTGVDHVLVFKDVKDQFLGLLKQTVIEFYGKDPQQSPDYGRMVSDRQYARIVGLLDSGDVYYGGEHDSKDRYVAPTILVNTHLNSQVMQEEIFGPILPVLEVSSIEEVIEYVNAQPKPLGLYVFAEDLNSAERILDATESGDAAVNDCTIHPLVPELPFGGVGNSGMASITANGGSAPTQTPAASFTTARQSTPASGTRHTPRSQRRRAAGFRAVSHFKGIYALEVVGNSYPRLRFILNPHFDSLFRTALASLCAHDSCNDGRRGLCEAPSSAKRLLRPESDS
jgi:acyl-CoA reductase-like NAD-dependent aldehyde dehydrogenase